MTCQSCTKPLAQDANPRQRFCNVSCRSRAFRARDAATREAAHDVVTRITRAIYDGDFAALADIQRDAVRLFG